jgi:hypothetical protein
MGATTTADPNKGPKCGKHYEKSIAEILPEDIL